MTEERSRHTECGQCWDARAEIGNEELVHAVLEQVLRSGGVCCYDSCPDEKEHVTQLRVGALQNATYVGEYADGKSKVNAPDTFGNETCEKKERSAAVCLDE